MITMLAIYITWLIIAIVVGIIIGLCAQSTKEYKYLIKNLSWNKCKVLWYNIIKFLLLWAVLAGIYIGYNYILSSLLWIIEKSNKQKDC